jgi:hypothetical protein
VQAVLTIALDIDESVFQAYGVNGAGQAVVHRQLKRYYMLTFFQKLPPLTNAWPISPAPCGARPASPLVCTKYSSTGGPSSRLRPAHVAGRLDLELSATQDGGGEEARCCGLSLGLPVQPQTAQTRGADSSTTPRENDKQEVAMAASIPRVLLSSAAALTALVLFASGPAQAQSLSMAG